MPMFEALVSEREQEARIAHGAKSRQCGQCVELSASVVTTPLGR